MRCQFLNHAGCTAVLQIVDSLDNLVVIIALVEWEYQASWYLQFLKYTDKASYELHIVVGVGDWLYVGVLQRCFHIVVQCFPRLDE